MRESTTMEMVVSKTFFFAVSIFHFSFIAAAVFGGDMSSCNPHILKINEAIATHSIVTNEIYLRDTCDSLRNFSYMYEKRRKIIL